MTGCRANRWRSLNSGSGFSIFMDATQFPTCYLSSAFALGFVALETEFCLLDVLSNAIAEIRSSEAYSTSISP